MNDDSGAIITSLDEYLEEKPKSQCSACRRKSWSPVIGKCGMRQPDGSYCNGIMESLS